LIVLSYVSIDYQSRQDAKKCDAPFAFSFEVA